jgi:hypothetical protein
MKLIFPIVALIAVLIAYLWLFVGIELDLKYDIEAAYNPSMNIVFGCVRKIRNQHTIQLWLFIGLFVTTILLGYKVLKSEVEKSYRK